MESFKNQFPLFLIIREGGSFFSPLSPQWDNLDNRYKDIFVNFSLSKGYPALDPISPRRGRHNSRWGLLVNLELDPKRWMY